MKKITFVFMAIFMFAGFSFAATQLLIIGPGQTINSGVAGNGRIGASETTSQQTAGSYFYVTVYACDASWNVDAAATGSVSLSSTDAQATTPAATALSSGKAIMRVTMGTAGTTVLTASHGTYSPDVDNIPVTFGALDHFGFTSAISNKNAGQLFLIFAAAFDAYNNTVTSFNNSVTVGALKNGITPLTASHWYISNTSPAFVNGIINGIYAARVYEKTVNCSLKITYNTVVGISSSFTVNASAFSRFVIIAPGETYSPGAGFPADSGKSGIPGLVNSGAPVSITVYAADNYANLVTTVADVYEITASDPAGLANGTTPPVQLALANGAGSFNFSFVNSGLQGIYCDDITSPGTAGSVTVLVQAGTLAYFDITNVPSYTAAGSPIAPVITARDGAGNFVSAYSGNAWVTSPDTDWTLPPESTIGITNGTLYGAAWYVTFTAGQSTLNMSFRRAGSARIFACDDPAGTTQNAAGHRGLSPSITINCGSLDRIQVIPPGINPRPGTTDGYYGNTNDQLSGAPFSVTVNACDAWWNVISTTGADGSSDTISLSTNDNANADAARPGQPFAGPPVTGFLNMGTVVINVSYNIGNALFNISADDSSRGGVASGTCPDINVSQPGGPPASYSPGRFKISAPGGSDIGMQAAGVPFTISITAYTDNSQSVIDTGFNGMQVALKASNQYSDSEYTLTPYNSVPFSAGVAVMQVTMYRASVTWTGGGVAIDLGYGAETSVSNTFSLKWGPVNSVLTLISGMTLMPGLMQIGFPGYKGYYGSPIIMEAGQPFEADVVYVDNNYNRVYDMATTYCRITSSDPLASSGDSPQMFLNSGNVYVTITAGTYSTTSMRLRTVGVSGIQNITSVPGGSLLNNTSPSISVRHTTCDHLGVAVLAGVWTAGIPGNITLTALDAWQNVCDNRNLGLPFNNSVFLMSSGGVNTMYPQQCALSNGQAVVSAAFFKAPDANTSIMSSYSSISGSASGISVKSNSFSRLLLMDMDGGMTRINGQYTGTAPVLFPMATGAPFAIDPMAANVSWQSNYDHFGKVHSFIVYSCDAYGNVTTTPEMQGNTVTIAVNDAFAQPVTPAAIDPAGGYCLVDLIFHTAKNGMCVTAHTTEPGVADFTSPTFTTFAGPAYGMQLVAPGMYIVDGSAHTSGALSVWYNGVSGNPNPQVSGAAFPVTARASDVFGNYSQWVYNPASAYAESNPYINPYPASFPTYADRFMGYFGDVAPGMLTFTAKYDATQSTSVLLHLDDLSPSGPFCLNRALDTIPVIPIVFGATETATYTPSYMITGTPAMTATISPTITPQQDTCTDTPVQTGTAVLTATCTATCTPSCTLTQTETTQAVPTATVTATVPGILVSTPAQGTTYVFPQPADNTANFVYFLEEQQEIAVRVYDLTGMLKVSVNVPGKPMTVNVTPVDVSKLPSGLYVYSISAGAAGKRKLNFQAGRLVILK